MLASCFEADLAAALASQFLCDATVDLLVGGRPQKVHRLVLARHAFFRQLLTGAFAESGAPSFSTLAELKIDLPEEDAEAFFGDVLPYLYSGSVADISSDGPRLMRVLALASRLCLDPLIVTLSDVLLESSSEADLPVLAAFAEDVGLTRLARHVRSRLEVH